MLEALTRDEYLESIAFGTLHLLKGWGGTREKHDLAQVIEDQNDLAGGIRDIYRVLNIMQDEIHTELNTLRRFQWRMRGNLLQARKRRISHQEQLLAYVRPVWDEYRIKVQEEQEHVESLQVM